MARRKARMGTKLFKAACIVDDVEAVESGNPRKVARRTETVALGRALGGPGVWRRLWR